MAHFEHGSARYGGRTAVPVGAQDHDLTVFVYRDGDELMLPAEPGGDFWAYRPALALERPGTTVALDLGHGTPADFGEAGPATSPGPASATVLPVDLWSRRRRTRRHWTLLRRRLRPARWRPA